MLITGNQLFLKTGKKNHYFNTKDLILVLFLNTIFDYPLSFYGISSNFNRAQKPMINNFILLMNIFPKYKKYR